MGEQAMGPGLSPHCPILHMLTPVQSPAPSLQFSLAHIAFAHSHITLLVFAPLPSFAHALAPLRAVSLPHSPSLRPMVSFVPLTFCARPHFSCIPPTSAIRHHSLLSLRRFSPHCRREALYSTT